MGGWSVRFNNVLFKVSVHNNNLNNCEHVYWNTGDTIVYILYYIINYYVIQKRRTCNSFKWSLKLIIHFDE